LLSPIHAVLRGVVINAVKRLSQDSQGSAATAQKDPVNRARYSRIQGSFLDTGPVRNQKFCKQMETAVAKFKATASRLQFARGEGGVNIVTAFYGYLPLRPRLPPSSELHR
jgi:hypothetical protein